MVETHKIVYQKSFLGYFMDWFFKEGNDNEGFEFGSSDEFCSYCGKKEVFARCAWQGRFGNCNKVICKNCAKKINGKFLCNKHAGR